MRCASSCTTATRSRADTQPCAPRRPGCGFAARAGFSGGGPPDGYAPDRRHADRRRRAGSRPLQPGSDDIPAYRPDSRAGRGRIWRGRTQPDCCAGVPGRRWAGWIALLIGVASAPQASASGFQSPDMIPDVATAALGVLLAVTILATVGRAHVAADRKPAGWRFSVRTGGEDSVGCEIEEKPQRPISTTTRS